MTANRWIQFILIWILLCILVIPVVNAGLTSVVSFMFSWDKYDLRFGYAKGAWGWTLLVYSWTMFALVVIPYSLANVYTILKKQHIIIKCLVFYLLLVLMGLIFPEASIREAFTRGDLNRIWVLYFFTTLILCPLSNYVLLKLERTR